MGEQDRNRSPKRRTYVWRLVACATVGLAACGDGDGGALAQRRAEVAERGAQVMPFDLDATTHTFTPTDEGGVQTVTADDPDDTDQIELIRTHLREERDKFARGDFEDPAAIHGHDMEGMAELAAGHRHVEVAYDDLPDGGRLTYTTDRPDLIEAVHAWFARQQMDHGAHPHTGG